MATKQRRRKLRWGRISLLAAAVLALIVYFGYQQRLKTQELRQIEANRQVLKALESKSVGAIEQRLREIRKEFGIGNIALDQIPNRKYFEDSVFMGDSLTLAISHYDLLPASNVVAALGRNTGTALEDLPLLERLSPDRLFLWYGLNDLSIFDSAEAFAASYEGLIQAILAQQPEARIVILAILPVTQTALAKQSELKSERLQAFNQALAKLAQTKGFDFLDISKIVESRHYEPDGIHMTPAFYTDLFNFLKKEFIEKQ